MNGQNWTRITIPITLIEREALRQLAEMEKRDLRLQASLLIRAELMQRDLIKSDPVLCKPHEIVNQEGKHG